jgi:hypothetical protein
MGSSAPIGNPHPRDSSFVDTVAPVGQLVEHQLIQPVPSRLAGLCLPRITHPAHTQSARLVNPQPVAPPHLGSPQPHHPFNPNLYFSISRLTEDGQVSDPLRPAYVLTGPTPASHKAALCFSTHHLPHKQPTLLAHNELIPPVQSPPPSSRPGLTTPQHPQSFAQHNPVLSTIPHRSDADSCPSNVPMRRKRWGTPSTCPRTVTRKEGAH